MIRSQCMIRMKAPPITCPWTAAMIGFVTGTPRSGTPIHRSRGVVFQIGAGGECPVAGSSKNGASLIARLIAGPNFPKPFDDSRIKGVWLLGTVNSDDRHVFNRFIGH